MPCQDERRRSREAESDGDIAGCGRKRGARVCEGSAANIVYYVCIMPMIFGSAVAVALQCVEWCRMCQETARNKVFLSVQGFLDTNVSLTSVFFLCLDTDRREDIHVSNRSRRILDHKSKSQTFVVAKCDHRTPFSAYSAAFH